MADETQSLLSWLNTFEVLQGSPITAPSQLSDGVALVDVLAEIDSSHFKPCSNREFGDNAILKASNVKKLISSLKAYYHEVLGQRGLDITENAAEVVAGEPESIIHLLMFVLGVAIQCENKQIYINKIMGLEPAAQQWLMVGIQSIMEHAQDYTTAAHRGSTDENALFAELQSKQDELEHIKIVVEELEAENKALKSGKDAVEADLNDIKSELANAQEQIAASATGTANGNKAAEEKAKVQLDKMKAEVEGLKRDRERLLTDVHELKGQMDDKDRELSDARRAAAESNKLAKENRDLKDEIDVLRGQADQLEKSEAMLEKYKRKMEEMGDVRKQMKEMENQMQTYIDKNLDLEDALKKGGSLKPQLDKYREQVSALEMEKTKLLEDVQKSQFEASKLTERLDKAEGESKSLKQHAEQLQSKVRKLEQAANENDDMSPGVGSESFAEFASADLREKVARLEREVKVLREGGGGGEGNAEIIQMMEAQIDDANKIKQKLQVEVLAAKQKVSELEDEVKTVRLELTAKAQELEIALESTAETQTQSSKGAEEARESSKKLKDTLKELEDAQLTLVSTRRELVSVKQNYNKLAKEHGAMAMDLEAKSEVTTDQMGSMAKECARLDAEVIHLKQRIERVQEDLARERDEKEKALVELKAVREEHIADVKSMLVEKNALNAQIMDVKQRNNEGDIKLAQHQASLIAKEAECERVANELEKAQSELRAKTAKIEDLVAMNSTNEKLVLEMRLASSEGEKDELKRAGSNSSAVHEIQTRLETKTAECLKLMDDKKKLEKYMTQARQVIQDLNQRNKETEEQRKELVAKLEQQSQQFQSHFAHENEELKKELVVAKKLRDEARKASEEEMRLVTSAFYEIGLELQRVKLQHAQVQQQSQAAAQAASGKSAASSWLNKMRKGV